MTQKEWKAYCKTPEGKMRLEYCRRDIEFAVKCRDTFEAMGVQSNGT